MSKDTDAGCVNGLFAGRVVIGPAMPYVSAMDVPIAFEWDERKAAQNYAKHGIPFEAAMEVFLDPARIEEPDVRREYEEDRVNVIGVVDEV